MRAVTFDTLITDLPWSRTRNVLPHHSAFFLSFTDGIGQVFKREGLQKDDTVLIPEFYCPDTAHALMTRMNVTFYKVHDDLTIDEDDFEKQISRVDPKAVILYSFFGGSIPTRLYSLLRKDYPDILVIDDYAHRWLNGKTMKWHHPRHIYIDSIRKHTPFLGSHVVSEDAIGLTVASISAYSLTCHLLRASENVINALARVTGSERLREIGDSIFESLDSRIGQADKAAGGDIVAHVMWPYIDVKKVHEQLSVLKARYANNLRNPLAELIKKYDISYIPLRIEHSKMDTFIETLGTKGIAADQLWEYEAWMPARARRLYDSVVILPLTMAMSTEDIDRMCEMIKHIL
ncbi:MAG: DegT/DnrJ/EryC1/StrS aminotransferase family [Candidatus Parcubacteria bacterium]|jgi:hypothetical protein